MTGLLMEPLRDSWKPEVFLYRRLTNLWCGLVKTFRETHKPISKYLFSDIGITLMNIDGEIMNNILMRLMDKGILGLSVYDSVIVAEQYADILREIMVAEYEKVMKFKPMF